MKLPPDYRLELVGEFNNMQGALARLSVTVPLAILLIAVLLFVNFGSLVDTLLALSVIPMAVAGGVVASPSPRRRSRSRRRSASSRSSASR